VIDEGFDCDAIADFTEGFCGFGTNLGEVVV
jgi:hypothetical protein